MTRTFMKSIAAATLLSGAVLASQPASAIGIRNCTDIVIKVQVFNNNDALKWVALAQANLGVGDYSNLGGGGTRKQIKVFRAQFLDHEILVKGGLNGNSVYSIRGKNGRYSVSTQNTCQTASTGGGGGGGGGAVVTIPVDGGQWVGAGKKPLIIRAASNTSFTLRRKGKKGKATYSLVGRDTYRGSDGNMLVMVSRGQANWGGRRIRLK